jgi:hypothetical protein
VRASALLAENDETAPTGILMVASAPLKFAGMKKVSGAILSDAKVDAAHNKSAYPTLDEMTRVMMR